MNKPYVKKLDENGVVRNLITKEYPYLNHFPNRRSRRAYNKPTGRAIVQVIHLKDEQGNPTGELKNIKHYKS